jgi:hypothetical protein
MPLNSLILAGVNNETGVLFVGDELVLDTTKIGKSVMILGHFK